MWYRGAAFVVSRVKGQDSHFDGLYSVVRSGDPVACHNCQYTAFVAYFRVVTDPTFVEGL